MHVDDIFAVGLKRRCNTFRDELNLMVPVKNLGELRWYGGCHYTREREMGTLTISQKTFADELVKTFCVTSTQSVPLRVGVKLEEFNEDEKVENWPLRELVGSSMWLSISTRPDIANAVRAVARYCTAPRAIHRKAAEGDDAPRDQPGTVRLVGSMSRPVLLIGVRRVGWFLRLVLGNKPLALVVVLYST